MPEQFQFPKAGEYTLKLKPVKLNTKEDVGLTVRWVRLKPVNNL